MSLLEVSNLGFSYGSRFALREVSLALAAGEIVALLGPNGSGKSTLIKSLLGTLRASGDIHWLGRPMADWSRRELARKVAYLAQNPAFEPGQTATDVLRLGRAPYWAAFGIESERDQQIIEQISGDLQLGELLNRPMEELSGGQRQRVFVARCLVQEPAAILLDEPSTFLDLQHQVSLAKLLHDLATQRSIGILMASHDLNLAATFTSKAILLTQGRVAYSGSWAGLNVDMLSEVYGVKMLEIKDAQGRRVFVPHEAFASPVSPIAPSAPTC